MFALARAHVFSGVFEDVYVPVSMLCVCMHVCVWCTQPKCSACPAPVPPPSPVTLEAFLQRRGDVTLLLTIHEASLQPECLHRLAAGAGGDHTRTHEVRVAIKCSLWPPPAPKVCELIACCTCLSLSSHCVHTAFGHRVVEPGAQAVNGQCHAPARGGGVNPGPKALLGAV